MKEYNVRVVRTGISDMYITVRANNEDEAKDIAIMEASDVQFTEYDQTKTVEEIIEI